VCCAIKRKRTPVEERVKERSRGSQWRKKGHHGMNLFPIQRSREPRLSSGDSSRCSHVAGSGGEVPHPRIEMLWVCEHRTFKKYYCMCMCISHIS
jgi:hypothetical protein